ncbi:hypothetical protein [Hyphomicrobium sp. D-2]|uniref:hypothetical protein n=1 Tax=Hyphomicrobium sp. D-2 TaxID=3041621 RepID=UPI002456FCC7|nr:hypothetical protein [Hyphomicrobium sp. D-2]MDH4982610.1 hypothetical protein [Hyphomicrobium sp. D-2]
MMKARFFWIFALGASDFLDGWSGDVVRRRSFDGGIDITLAQRGALPCCCCALRRR